MYSNSEIIEESSLDLFVSPCENPFRILSISVFSIINSCNWYFCSNNSFKNNAPFYSPRYWGCCFNFISIINFMQESAKILYKSIASVIKKARLENELNYTDFCYENDIPMSTYDYILLAKTQASFFNVAKVVKALGLSFEEFGRLLDKELPDDFMNFEE